MYNGHPGPNQLAAICDLTDCLVAMPSERGVGAAMCGVGFGREGMYSSSLV